MIIRDLEDLDRFCKIYRYQEIEDIHVKKNQLTKVYFFDSLDLLNITRGIWLYDQFSYFRKDLFRSNNTLIYACTLAGWLGKIRIFKPHLDELHGKLGDPILFPKQVIIGETESFLNECGINLDEVFSKKIDIHSLELNSIDLFKIQYLLNPLIWQKRVNYLFKELINFDDKQSNYTSILESQVYRRAFTELSKTRKKLNRNNTIDAASVALFFERIKLLKQKDSKEIPIFYSSSKVLSNCLNILKEEFDFSYTIKHKGSVKTIPLIRDSLSIFTDIIFDSDNKSNELQKFSSEIEGLEKDIEDQVLKKYSRSQDLGNFLDSVKKSIRTHVDSYELMSRIFSHFDHESIIGSINDIVRSGFFQKVLNQKEGKDIVKQSFTTFFNYKNASKKQLLELSLKNKKLISAELSIELISMNKIQTAWLLKEKNRLAKNFDKVDKALDHIENIKENKEFQKLDRLGIIESKGIIRFNPTHVELQKLETYLSKLLDTSDDEDYDFIQTKLHIVANLVYTGYYSKDDSEFFIGLCLLWILDKHEHIVYLSKQFLESENIDYRIKLIYACSIMRLPEDDRKDQIEYVKVILDQLEDENSLGLYPGLSFLNFQLWEYFEKENGPTAILHKKYEDSINKPTHIFVTKAINAIEEYMEKKSLNEDVQLSFIPNMSEMYCYNNLLYILTVASESTVFNKKSSTPLDKLLSNHSRVDMRIEPRYLDTLACYYFRIANESDKEKKKLNLKTAQWYNSDSLKYSDKARYRTLSSLIVNELNRL